MGQNYCTKLEPSKPIPISASAYTLKCYIICNWCFADRHKGRDLNRKQLLPDTRPVALNYI